MQFIFYKIENKERNIQRTIILVNFILEICPLINIIVDWKKKFGYLDCYTISIKSYYSIISDQDKKLIGQTFLVFSNNNLTYIIFIAINVYGIKIINPNMKTVIQQDFSIIFDTIIQQLGTSRRKNR